MPIFEYSCKGCGDQFEILILPHSKENPACPSCGSEDLDQMISLFAVSSEQTRKDSFQRAKKEHQKSLKDKKIAEHEARLHHH